MSAVHTTTVRMPADLAFDATLVSRVDGITMTKLINEAIAAHIKQRRADPEFRKRLQERIAADEKILQRISTPVEGTAQ